MTSNERIIEIFLRLLDNQNLNVANLSNEYDVDIRTIQRDFSTIKKLAHLFDYELVKEKYTKNMYLQNPNKLVFEDTLAITKILLASRALPKEEMEILLKNLIVLNPDGDAESITKSISNELTFYYPLTHNQELLQKIKEMEQFILEKKLIEILYKKNDGSLTKRTVLPVSIFFSDYYFYIICYEVSKERYINLRLDRFIEIKQTKETFKIVYSERHEEKKLREQMILMHFGKEVIFRFKFSGIVEAALDKFPNSKIIETYEDSSVLIEASAYDKGAMMWLLSQKSLVKVMSPPSFVQAMKEEIEKMLEGYE